MNTERPRLLLAYSGGLDTSYLVAWFTREGGYDVTALTVDCGGFDPSEAEELHRRALAFGAKEHRFVDARSALFERVLRWLIAGNVKRSGAYPLCVASERSLQAEILAETALAGGFGTVAHGCTGAGNDQVRFEAALSVAAGGLEVLAPVRDLALSREDEAAYLEQHDLPLPAAGGKYSVNSGLWGLTIGGGAMHTSDQPLPEEAWQLTRGATGSANTTGAEARIRIDFEGGIPVALDGEALDPVPLIERLNREAGALGVGRGYHLGDTVLGIKGRIAFEAPAATLLIDAHRELEKLVLTEEQRFWKDHLGDVYGRRLHQGLLFDPFMRDIEAFMASSQNKVSGTVSLLLAGGSALVEGTSSPYSLLAASDARYGERASGDADPSSAVWLARVLSEPARLARRAQETSNRPLATASAEVPR